eukprot:gene10595-19333_t
MEVIARGEEVIPRTSATTNGNGCCNENLLVEQIDRIQIHTGNISHWSSLKRKSTQNPATELQESLIKALKLAESQNSCTRVALQGKERIFCKNAASIEPVTETDRPLMKVTAKVFAHDFDKDQLREAVNESLAELNISQFDVIFLAFPAIPEDSRLTFTEVAKPLWREMEKLYEDELVSHLASCDLDAGKLKELLSWAKIKPEVNQVNLTSCCHMPQNLVEYAKQQEILLHTHGDPPTLLPEENVDRIVGSFAEDSIKGWQTRWVVRYSVVVKCRGVIRNKGYIASLQHSKEANGDVDH